MSRWVTAGVLPWCCSAPARPAGAVSPRSREDNSRFRAGFPPEGAWRKRVDGVRTARHRLLRAGPSAGAECSPRPLPRCRPGQWPDHRPGRPDRLQERTRALFPDASTRSCSSLDPSPGRPYSVKTFYEQLSNGNITVDGTVFPWVDGRHDRHVLRGRLQRHRRDGLLSAAAGSRFGELLLGALTSVRTVPAARPSGASSTTTGPTACPTPAMTTAWSTSSPSCSRIRTAPVGRPGHLGSPLHHRAPGTAARHTSRAHRGPAIPGEFIKVDDYTMQSALGGTTACDVRHSCRSER